MSPGTRREFLKGLGSGLALTLAGERALGAALASGPGTPLWRVYGIPAPDFSWTRRHPGLETLLFRMAFEGRRFYDAEAEHPLAALGGLIAKDDVVLIKVNAQWKYRGATNSDVVRGLVQRILDHPEGFEGEVVIIENGQGRGSLNCDTTSGCDGGTREVHANAENESHSFSWLVSELFDDPRVGERLLDPIRKTWISDTDHVTEGYRKIGHASYPCFETPGGRRVEFREGLWTGAGHDSAHLKWINVPTMKDHKDLDVTGCLKHCYGLITTWDEEISHHNPYEAGKIMGDFYGLVRAPVLHLLDHVWVAHASLCGYPPETTTRRDTLVAGFDPCALDSWSARSILYPISGDPVHDPDMPSSFRTYLLDARDTLNAHGGADGRDATIHAADVSARHQDAREVLAALSRQGEDVIIDWGGGLAPYKVERSTSADFASPETLAEALWDARYVDHGAGLAAQPYFYRVTGAPS